jgi:hypothetical protein
MGVDEEDIESQPLEILQELQAAATTSGRLDPACAEGEN